MLGAEKVLLWLRMNRCSGRRQAVKQGDSRGSGLVRGQGAVFGRK